MSSLDMKPFSETSPPLNKMSEYEMVHEKENFLNREIAKIMKGRSETFVWRVAVVVLSIGLMISLFINGWLAYATNHSSQHIENDHKVMSQKDSKFRQAMGNLTKDLHDLQTLHDSVLLTSKQKERDFEETIERLKTDIKDVQMSYDELSEEFNEHQIECEGTIHNLTINNEKVLDELKEHNEECNNTINSLQKTNKQLQEEYEEHVKECNKTVTTWKGNFDKKSGVCKKFEVKCNSTISNLQKDKEITLQEFEEHKAECDSQVTTLKNHQDQLSEKLDEQQKKCSKKVENMKQKVTSMKSAAIKHTSLKEILSFAFLVLYLMNI